MPWATRPSAKLTVSSPTRTAPSSNTTSPGSTPQVSAAAHTPFIAAAAPQLMQMDSWQELSNPRDLTKIFQTPEYAGWRSLRESEDSRYVGLAMPRFLARLPYGSKTDPVEEFDFEESLGEDHIHVNIAGYQLRRVRAGRVEEAMRVVVGKPYHQTPVFSDEIEYLSAIEEGEYVSAGQALARLDGERLRLEMLAAKANLEQARSELARNTDLHDRGLISAAAFDNLQFTLEALQATYELRKLEHGYATIRAPISGYVASREIKPGQHLSVDEVAFRITDTSELIAYLHIPQAELEKFSAGHTANVEVASMPKDEFPATITRISPTIDTRNGTFRATAVIDNADGELAPGMFGRFTIAWEEHQKALVIPAAALIGEDEESAVYVVSDDQVTRRTIETGIETDGMIEILGGLDEQDIVVVVGHSGLRDGSKVLASNNGPGSFTG